MIDHEAEGSFHKTGPGSPGSAGDTLKTGVYDSGDDLCGNEPNVEYDEMLEGNLQVHSDS